MSKENKKAFYAKIQATRRRTLFPLKPAEVCAQRMRIAGFLSRSGLPVYAIRQVMNLKPDQVRTYIAKEERRRLPKIECTEPAITQAERVQRVVRRTVQLYNDADYVRLFDDPEDYATADFKLGDKNKGCRKTADVALAKFGIKRTTRWMKAEWGWFARVSASNDELRRRRENNQ